MTEVATLIIKSIPIPVSPDRPKAKGEDILPRQQLLESFMFKEFPSGNPIARVEASNVEPLDPVTFLQKGSPIRFYDGVFKEEMGYVFCGVVIDIASWIDIQTNPIQVRRGRKLIVVL